MIPISIPKVQKALVCQNPGPDYELKVLSDYPVPEPGTGEVLVRLSSSGICHSDLSYLKNEWAPELTLNVKVPGHEGSGRIVKLGPDVNEKVIAVGTRVGSPYVRQICHNCENCFIPGMDVYCDNGVYCIHDMDGTFAQYCILRADYICRVPEALDEKCVGPILCGGTTVYKSLKQSNLYAGHWLAIIGAGGGLGQMAILYARSRGLRVVAIDTGADKRETCTRLGAETFIDFKESKDVVAEVIAVSGRGCHGVQVIAPTRSAYNLSVKIVRFMAILWLWVLPIRPMGLVFKNVKVIGSLVGNQQDISEALDLATRWNSPPNIEMYTMEEVSTIFEKMETGQLNGRAVIMLD
ncbi:hypothetical protein CANCADRAFT_55505 [Tortispora caseinolytica NRRL Y-17796]|uniref:Enoyl reductase (ER) domain-containing protein n=1 Tax=Tortispora caseinolytica NRRL Y-17796 TaxID=767744 RepID=A0A1E4TIW4_9ASCO|nr:hypothetical protein CANCADRAFT_55505 [Tortispora caseinolytica NRRL Y-17796]